MNMVKCSPFLGLSARFGPDGTGVKSVHRSLTLFSPSPDSFRLKKYGTGFPIPRKSFIPTALTKSPNTTKKDFLFLKGQASREIQKGTIMTPAEECGQKPATYTQPNTLIPPVRTKTA